MKKDAPSRVEGKAVLVVGHPGHELRVFRWLELAKPTVHVLTDGSGHTEHPRLHSTSEVLSAVGAQPGALYGHFSDAEVYRALLAGDPSELSRVVHALAEALVGSGADYVVADALEGFNPGHDLCRYVVNAAVTMAREAGRPALRNFDFLLEGNPSACPDHLRADAITLELTDEELERKIAAARAYPELRQETESALGRFGTAAFRTECLRPVFDPRQGLEALDEEPPYYERYGERQVAAGRYDHVIRYRAHVQPLVRALWHEVGLNEHASAVLRG